ncbi:MAG: hypothetical protein NT052_00720 [Candidatus Shapirobacteria bacterium]|nr:hypothetical protein [Candidatus Shapirobacteria bacterium]
MEPKNNLNPKQDKKIISQLPNRFRQNNFRPTQATSNKVRSFGGHR